MLRPAARIRRDRHAHGPYIERILERGESFVDHTAYAPVVQECRRAGFRRIDEARSARAGRSCVRGMRFLRIALKVVRRQ